VNSHQVNRNRYGLTLYIAEDGSRFKHDHQDDVIIAEIGKEIVFDPTILDTYHYDGWQPVHHDLLVVCAAVEFADRRCARPGTHWFRTFHITVPVLEPGTWQRPDVQAYLSDTLRHLTGDDWHFSFVHAESSAVNKPRQRSLPFANSKQFAIAYSNGLDSRCVSGIFDKGDIAVRVRVTNSKDKTKQGERPFDQIPFKVKLVSSRESSVRSRGFKFAAITAIAGHLSGVSEIIVPESGQGALGPVLLPLHNVYADYRNYPTFFRKMERFIKVLLGYTVAYKQRRLWYTKGQTISAYLTQPGKIPEYVLRTRSCWQQRWNVRLEGEFRQCGLCAACLLRRMSMHAACVDEPSATYTFADLTVRSYAAATPRSNRVRPSEMVEYGSVGARHLQHLADLAGQPNTILRRHVFEIAQATDASEQNTLDNLRNLLVQHAEEWRDFIDAQGKHSFLNNWTKGGRYGRSE
jgi:7-cyano-7-deazaguanine synthase in queuosine biosynthesis